MLDASQLLIPGHTYLRKRGWRKVAYLHDGNPNHRVWNHDRYYVLETDGIYTEKTRKIFLPFSKEDAVRKQTELDGMCWTQLYSLDTE